jgi:hypothetical protein
LFEDRKRFIGRTFTGSDNCLHPREHDPQFNAQATFFRRFNFVFKQRGTPIHLTAG